MTENKSTKSILPVLFLGVLMGALDISIVGPAIPEISKTVKVSHEAMSWVFSIYVLFNLVGLPLLARLSDVFGRRNIYMISVSVFGLGSLLVAFAHTFPLLLTGRAVQGFGASGIFPVAAAVIGDVFPPEKRGRALGMIGAVFGLAFLIGPIIAGFVLKYFEWNTLFSINIPIAGILILGAYRLLPRRSTGNMKNFDWPGIVLLGIFLASFALAINNINRNHFFTSLISYPVIYYFSLALIFFIILILFERKASMPVINLKLFSKLQIRLVGLIAIGTGIFQASFVFIPDYAVHNFGVASSKASFMLIPVVLATAVGSPVSGRMLDKFGSRIIVLIGVFTAGIGVFMMSFVGRSVLDFYIAGALIGFGLSMLAGPSLRYIILNEVEPSERALTQGLLTMFISLGQITGSAVIGAIAAPKADGTGGYDTAFLVLAFMNLILFAFAFRLKSRRKELSFNTDGR